MKELNYLKELRKSMDYLYKNKQLSVTDYNKFINFYNWVVDLTIKVSTNGKKKED